MVARIKVVRLDAWASEAWMWIIAGTVVVRVHARSSSDRPRFGTGPPGVTLLSRLSCVGGLASLRAVADATTPGKEEHMKIWLLAPVVPVAVIMLAATSPLAQQIRQRDPTPFERCKPLATIASRSNLETLRQLQGLLTDRGFTIASVDGDRGELTAIKKDSPTDDRSDRVLLWLERDPVKPAERAYIHVLYGRFEPFFGSTDGPVRVQPWPNEVSRMTSLKEAIIAFALSRP